MYFSPGMIVLAAWSYTPVNFLLCDGKQYSASDYKALFGVIGFTYGGDGQNNFAVPNLVQRIPIGSGANQSAPSANFTLGQMGGAVAITLSGANISNHGHANVKCNFNPATISGTAKSVQIGIPFQLHPTMETETPANGLLLSIGTSSAGAVSMYSNKAKEGEMNAATQTTSVAIAPVTLDVDFVSTNPGSSQPVPTLPPVLAINYFICCTAANIF
ncbi:MAG: tail fiber protein [Magnetococcales bacterium]|nr:tail fiber protein [Magnetococcales bacterium]